MTEILLEFPPEVEPFSALHHDGAAAGHLKKFILNTHENCYRR